MCGYPLFRHKWYIEPFTFLWKIYSPGEEKNMKKTQVKYTPYPQCISDSVGHGTCPQYTKGGFQQKNPKGYVPVVELMDSFFMSLMCGGLTLPFFVQAPTQQFSRFQLQLYNLCSSCRHQAQPPQTRQQEAPTVLPCSSNCLPIYIFFFPESEIHQRFFLPYQSGQPGWWNSHFFKNVRT